MGLHVLLHMRDGTPVPSWAFLEGSQPMSGIPMSLGVVKLVSLVVFYHGTTALQTMHALIPPSIPWVHCSPCRSHAIDQSCLQDQIISGMQETARNHPEGLCKYFKEARLRWGFASFFTGAPYELCTPAVLARC